MASGIFGKSEFELFYRMEFLNLVHFAGAYLHDEQKARDIAQDSLLALWENRSGIDPERNIRALVFTIARNKTLNYLRSSCVFTKMDDANEAIALLEDSSLDGLIDALDLEQLVRKEWASLPEKTRKTFVMSRFFGLKNREISRQEGVSEKAIEYRIGSALKKFRKLF